MELKVLGSVSPVIVDNNNCPGYLVNNNLLLDIGSGVNRYLDLPNVLKDLNIIITHLIISVLISHCLSPPNT